MGYDWICKYRKIKKVDYIGIMCMIGMIWYFYMKGVGICFKVVWKLRGI